MPFRDGPELQQRQPTEQTSDLTPYSQNKQTRLGAAGLSLTYLGRKYSERVGRPRIIEKEERDFYKKGIKAKKKKKNIVEKLILT